MVLFVAIGIGALRGTKGEEVVRIIILGEGPLDLIDDASVDDDSAVILVETNDEELALCCTRYE